MQEWGGLGVSLAVGLGLGAAWWCARAFLGGPKRPPTPATRPRAGAAADALLRVVRSELERGHKEAAVAHWLALVAAGLDANAPAALAIRMAALLRDGGRRDEAAAALRSALERSDGASALAVASRVARAAADLDPKLAVEAAWRALGSPELELLDRRDLERLVARLESGRDAWADDEARRAAAPAGEEPASIADAPPAGEESAPPACDEPAPASGPRPRPEPIELGHHPRRLEVDLAVPIGIEPGGLLVALESGRRRLLAWREIDALAVGAVEGLGAKPVLVVDLALGWCQPPEEPLRIVRLRGDRFDPCKLAETPGSPVDALRELVDRVLSETGAAPLPDLRAARGRPFAGFRDLTAFEEEVLGSEEGGSGASRPH